MGAPDDGEGDDGVDSRQLLLASVCLVGLVTAAVLAPVTGENDPIGIDGGAAPTDLIADILEFLLGQASDSTDEDNGDGQDEREGKDDGTGDGPDGPGSVPDWLRDIVDDLLGIDRSDGDGQGSGPPNPCQVSVGSNPNPGTETTVLVTLDGEPASDVRVWFNDEYVGRTNEQGTVTGEVPYVEKLEVTVESPTDRACAFSREPSVDGA